MNKTPKSYLAETDRVDLDDQDRYIQESLAAGDAGDEDAAWAWLRYVEAPASALHLLKAIAGADFIRQKGLHTATAEATYGKDWLEA
jgi:hypothetical protein